MSEENTHTKREVQELQRASFVAGAAWRVQALPGHSAFMEAARRYPVPKVKRPRVVQDPEWPAAEWRVVDDHLEMRSVHAVEGAGWLRWSDFRGSSDAAPLPKRVAMWADLLANPTVEVDE